MMAKLVGFVWLLLILTILIGSAAKADNINWHYLSCDQPAKPYEIRSELDERLTTPRRYIPHEEFREILRGSKGQKIGDFTVEELLELGDISQSKCNVNELVRRNYYRETNRESPAWNFITTSIVEQNWICKNNEDITARLYNEFMAATREDRLIIDRVRDKYNPKSGRFDYSVQQAVKKYVKSLPGKKKFVQQARRQRVLLACNNYISKTYILDGAWYRIHELAIRGTLNICKSIRNNFNIEIRDYTRYERRLRLVGRIVGRTAKIVGILAVIVAMGGATAFVAMTAPMALPSLFLSFLFLTVTFMIIRRMG